MRQHTHDVRNGLNSLELETSFLQELVTDEEGRESVDRVRQQVRRIAEQMRSLSAFFQDPKAYRAPLRARDLMLIWREQHESLHEPPAVEWIEEIGEEKVNVDAEMLATVFRELLSNARTFRNGEPAIASGRSNGEEVVFELREPKSAPVDTDGWGRRAFETTKRNGYGLGLLSVHRLLNANCARFTQRHVPNENALVTSIAFPVCD
jgi:hypothetical protein